MAIIGAEKDTHKTKFNRQICKCNKKALFPLAISASWLNNSPISEGSLIVSSDKETSDPAGGKSSWLCWFCHVTLTKSDVNIYFGLSIACVE